MKLRTLITLALLVTAIAVPGARAGVSPDAFERAVNAHRLEASPLIDGRSPDTRDAATEAQRGLDTTRLDPAIAAAIAARQRAPMPPNGRSPDTRDATTRLDPAIATAITGQQRSLPTADGRSPDTIDAGVQAHAPVVTLLRSSGFAWREFGIGIAAALAAMLLLTLLRPIASSARQARNNKTQTATTP